MCIPTMAQQKEMLICVDFGMTGSATRWRENLRGKAWSGQGTKIPTTLIYDNDDTLISWGTTLKQPCDKFVECFKIHITGASTPSFPGAPQSKQELFKWIQDYLTAICKQTAGEIDRHGTCWRRGNIVWNFTVPGCWPKSSVVRDFTHLAEEAAYSCLPSTSKESIRINTNLTEGEASAQCLINDIVTTRLHGMAPGNTLITCDIGGATTDVALSTISDASQLITAPQSTFIPAGLVGIDTKFWELARETLRNVMSPMQANHVALEMTRGASYLNARNKFCGTKPENRIEIALPSGAEVDDWPPQSSGCHENITTIMKQRLIIRSDAFMSLFEDLIEQIEAAIDGVMNEMTNVDRKPNFIGFCGGGSQSPYLKLRFRRRYRELTIIDQSELSFKPIMATLIGCSIACDRMELVRFVEDTQFGIQTKGVLKWQAAEEFKGSNFSMTLAFEVRFSCSTSIKIGARNTRTHTITASARGVGSGEETLESAQVPGSQTWVVDVDLSNCGRRVMSPRIKYEIVCKILGKWHIEFEARSELDGGSIPCVVTERQRT